MVLTSCKKTQSSTTPITRYVTLNVQEANSGKPIDGATITLLKIKNCNILCSYDELAKLTTDNKGEFKFDQALSPDRLLATHPKYWKTATEINNILMVPASWVRVHLKKNTNYLSNATNLELRTFTTDTISTITIFDFYSLGITLIGFSKISYLPTDTTLYLKSLGNHNDFVICDVLTDTIGVLIRSVQTSPKFVNAFDTINIEVNY